MKRLEMYYISIHTRIVTVRIIAKLQNINLYIERLYIKLKEEINLTQMFTKIIQGKN